jgi:arylsulfatase A
MLSRRSFLSLIPAATIAATKRKPNFVILLADDLGYSDLSCYGSQRIRTPNLDKMASEGLRFTSFYAAAPVCTPTRAALLTGCHPVRVGLGHRVLFPYSDTGLHRDEITIADTLKKTGYRTHCIGKWHLGHHKEFLPTRQGFDSYFGIPYSNDMGNVNYKAQNFVSPPLPLMKDDEIVESGPDQALLTRRYTEDAVRFIESSKDKPFFLYFAYHMPHTPLFASEKFKGKSQAGIYGDAVEELDWSVGEVMAALKRAGVDDDTVVLFTSDNGGVRPESNTPLRGRKNTTWEGGMREPCIVRWPGHVRKGSFTDEMATVMDVHPTFANIAGADLTRAVDGRDISNVLFKNGNSPHDALFYYRDERLQAVRDRQWKIHMYEEEWTDEDRARTKGAMLFDLRNDIGETTDVASKHPDIVKRLQSLAEKKRQDLGDAMQNRKGKNVRAVGRRT